MRRAGEYVRQPGGFQAFIPASLPPRPPMRVDGDLLVILSQADRSLGRLDGSIEVLPNPDLFLYMYIRKEAVLSSQIEGTQASLIDVLEYEAEALQSGYAHDVFEVMNYVNALNYGVDRLESLPLSLRLIREIHGKLLAGVRGGERNPGEFRKTQNWIGPPGCTLETATFVPPPVPDMRAALANLETFLHQEISMPILIRVGLAHAQFETVHPFLDGNGRMGRLLITLLLVERGVLRRPLLYLSSYFKKNRLEYYDRLQAVRDRGDWEGWLKFFLRGVHEVAQEATEVARNIVNLHEEHRELVIKQMGRGAGKGLMLLEALYQAPVTSVHRVADITHLSFANANALVKQLVALNLLTEVTGRKRNRVFTYSPYLDLFNDSLTGTPTMEAHQEPQPS
ncbi:MAG: Fic family protein [Symbiobacteriia bacterium]